MQGRSENSEASPAEQPFRIDSLIRSIDNPSIRLGKYLIGAFLSFILKKNDPSWRALACVLNLLASTVKFRVKCVSIASNGRRPLHRGSIQVSDL